MLSNESSIESSVVYDVECNVEHYFKHSKTNNFVKFQKDMDSNLEKMSFFKVSILLDEKHPGVVALQATMNDYNSGNHKGHRTSHKRSRYHTRDYFIRIRRQAQKDATYFPESCPFVLAGTFKFDNLKGKPKTPKVAYKYLYRWLKSPQNKYIDKDRFMPFTDFGDDSYHFHFLAYLKSDYRFNELGWSSSLAKKIASSWSHYGIAEINGMPTNISRWINYCIKPPKTEKPYSPSLNKSLVKQRNKINRKIDKVKHDNKRRKRDRVKKLKKQRKPITDQIKRNRMKHYPNKNSEKPYRPNLSGFKKISSNVNVNQFISILCLAKLNCIKSVSIKFTPKLINSITSEVLSDKPVNLTTGELLPDKVLHAITLYCNVPNSNIAKVQALITSFKLTNALHNPVGSISSLNSAYLLKLESLLNSLITLA